MLATHTPSFHSSLPTARTCYSRSALADSTNVHSRSGACGLDPKTFVYPISSTRTRCGWGDSEPSTGSASSLCHPRHPHLSSTPSPFPVTYKAPPTVSISLSAACSQTIPGDQSCGSGVQGAEPDLPDVRSVVPFPSTPLDGDMDVEMLDGTNVLRPNGCLPSANPPRKRRSAHSSISSLQGGLGKDAKQKRQRKSRRQVAELWWLGVIHRSILSCIESRQSVGELDSLDRSPSGPRDLGAMDHVLVERIQKRLADNGCVEGRSSSSLPRISSPATSSLSLLASSNKTLPFELSSGSNPKENIIGRTATRLPVSKAPPCASLSIVSYSPTPSLTSAPRGRHVRFETAQRPRQPQSRLRVSRRSPSPPARMGMVPANVQTLTLTIPQLVASLTLAHHEKSGLRMRGRTPRPTENGKNAGRSLPLPPCQVAQYGDGSTTQDKERTYQLSMLRAKLSCVPERKSSLSRVVCAEG